MKKLLLVSCLAAFMVAGCAPAKTGFQQYMSGYLGRPIDDFIAANGAPTGVQEEQGGVRRYAFVVPSTADVKTLAVHRPQGAAAAGAAPGQARAAVCNVYLFADKTGLIIHYESFCNIKI